MAVDYSGNFQFTYNGHPSISRNSMRSADINTDSQSRILAAAVSTVWTRTDILHSALHRHRYFKFPNDLCINSQGNLFVAEKMLKQCKIVSDTCLKITVFIDNFSLCAPNMYIVDA